MTPYAVLLVKPTDTDEVIRKVYHTVARKEHPDARSGGADDTWYTATAAYTAIKTAEARFAWQKQADLLSSSCVACDASGVRGTRLFKGKVKLCPVCEGKGRLV